MGSIGGTAGERRTETDSGLTNSSSLDSTFLHPALNEVAGASVRSIETQEGTVSSHVRDDSHVSLDL